MKTRLCVREEMEVRKRERLTLRMSVRQHVVEARFPFDWKRVCHKLYVTS